MTFVSLAETLKVDWSSELYVKRIRRMDPSVRSDCCTSHLLRGGREGASIDMVTREDEEVDITEEAKNIVGAVEVLGDMGRAWVWWWTCSGASRARAPGRGI